MTDCRQARAHACACPHTCPAARSRSTNPRLARASHAMCAPSTAAIQSILLTGHFGCSVACSEVRTVAASYLFTSRNSLQIHHTMVLRSIDTPYPDRGGHDREPFLRTRRLRIRIRGTRHGVLAYVLACVGGCVVLACVGGCGARGASNKACGLGEALKAVKL